MKILFISHTFPPILGGVESQNYQLSESLKKTSEVSVIANRIGKIYLPIFLPLAFFRAFFLMFSCDACILGNGVLAPLGRALKFFHRKKAFVCVVHGLDITFANRKGFLPIVYRNVNISALRKLDKLIMVGSPTVEEAVKIGIDRDKCQVIPNGVDVSSVKEFHTREELSKIFGSETKDKKVILRLGRFVPHKGVGWFLENIMPVLPADVVMIATGYRVARGTAGDSDDYGRCEEIVEKYKLKDRVRLLANLPQDKLKILLNTVDLVVSPNIKIPGSMEGFGINVVEAGGCERVVIASDLEGLAEAIKDEKNGFLVEPGNASKWVEKIIDIFNKGEEFRHEFGKKASQFVIENYSWEKISKRYLEEIEKVVQK